MSEDPPCHRLAPVGHHAQCAQRGMSCEDCGASFGALHSMNLFLKRPDLINGVIAMSGVYDLSEYTKGYFDDDAYSAENR